MVFCVLMDTDDAPGADGGADTATGLLTLPVVLITKRVSR
jgi:hypothetical protein